MSLRIHTERFDYTQCILDSLFETVEKHVIDHLPLEVTSRLVRSDVEYHDFRGIAILPRPEALQFAVSCSCGQCWSINHSDIQQWATNNGTQYMRLLEEFCRMINERYGAGERTVYRDHERWMYENEFIPRRDYPQNTDEVAPVEPKEVDNAINDLEL